MATTSEVKAGLDNIASTIKIAREKLTTIRAQIATQETSLNSLPTRFGDVLETINGYTPSGAFEALAKDELEKLTAEYLSLVGDVTACKTWIENNITEF
jgi:hypothetical protein